jgi:hypothetical protein
MGLVNAPATNAAVSSMPPARAGVASAVTSTARQIGTSMGVALLGSVIFSTAGPSGSAIGPALSPTAAQNFTSGLHNGYLVACVLALAGLALAAWAFRRTSTT